MSLIVSVAVLDIGGELQPTRAGRLDVARAKSRLTEISFIYCTFCGVPYSKLSPYSSVKGVRSRVLTQLTPSLHALTRPAVFLPAQILMHGIHSWPIH